MRTIEGIGPLLTPLENTIQQKLIPALTGRSACGETARRLLALPPNLVGLGIFDPSAAAERQFATIIIRFRLTIKSVTLVAEDGYGELGSSYGRPSR